MRKLFTLRWIGFHVLTIGCVALFIVLGRWQWDVGGTHRGTLRNYAYGLEWWIFAVILLGLWWRLLRQEIRGDAPTGDRVSAESSGPAAKAPRFRVPAPQVTAHVDDTEDPAMAAYNRYLKALNEQDASTGGRA